MPFLLFAALAATPALSQNLVVNPSFYQGLSGWTVFRDVPIVKLPGLASGDVTWSPDGSAGGGSYSAAFGAFTSGVHALVGLRQCVPIRGGDVYRFGARVRVDSLDGFAGLFVGVAFDPTPACRNFILPALGPSEGSLSGPAPTHGTWIPLAGEVIAPAEAHGANLYAVAFASGGGFAGVGIGGAVDDMFLTPSLSPSTVWILPSAAHVPGLGSSLWSTDVLLANPGTTDAFASLKFLGHLVDGRSGDERTVLVPAGALLSVPDLLGTFFSNQASYGAVRILTDPGVAVVSETSTPSNGGTVGQALPALGVSDFANGSAKMLAPIRENASFRTNLVLANATAAPLTAHVILFAADGTEIGTRDLDLPPLGMTQINRVAFELGASSLDAGRIAVSTSTPGGFVAAYASIIDNVTNDPRTLLPR
jgi:hypothetical protein